VKGLFNSRIRKIAAATARAELDRAMITVEFILTNMPKLMKIAVVQTIRTISKGKVGISP
jgi:hypothetical protein